MRMALQEMHPQQYNIIDIDRKRIVPGLEALGPDLVPAWGNLGHVDRLCDRCQAIPWDLFYFEEHDFDQVFDGSSIFATSDRSRRRKASYFEEKTALNDFHAAHEWESVESCIDDKRQRRELKKISRSRGEISASHRRVSIGESSAASSDVAQDTDLFLTGNLPGSCRSVSDDFTETELPIERNSSLPKRNPHLAESEKTYRSEGLRGRSPTRSKPERNRHSTGGLSSRYSECGSRHPLSDHGMNSQEQNQLDRSLTLSIESAKPEDMHRNESHRIRDDSIGDIDLEEEEASQISGRSRIPSSACYTDSSDTSFQYFGQNFRPHIYRSDDSGPEIRFWAKGNSPSLADVREAAHQGCHLCSMIMTSLLVERSNRIFGISLAENDATEVFDDDELFLYGSVDDLEWEKSQTCTRYLGGYVSGTGRHGAYGISFSFAVLDEEELFNHSPPLQRKQNQLQSSGCMTVSQTTDAASTKSGHSVLPTRIIVVRGVEGGGEPFLQESNGIRAEYATLSYSWGQCKDFRTTQASYAERCASIPLRTMPRTFRDAINMTIALGLEYLWIDAVCVIQDSVEDCQRELGSMAQIYTHSTITIAAVGATSADSGFPISRNKLAMVDCRVSPDTVISARFSRQEHVLNSGTLHSRAWCFQEVELSPRLLSCGAKELYFQCHRGIRREGRPLEFLVDNENGGSAAKVNISGIRFCDHSPKADVSEIYDNWYPYIWAYSKLDLTYSSDKITAISGLASRFLRLFENEADRPIAEDYLAGIWRADLLKGMLSEKNYRHPRPRQPIMYRAPSWSWAGTEAENWKFRTRPSQYYCQVLEATVTPVSGLNPFGPVRSGRITLYGPVVPLPACAFDRDEFEKDPANRSRRFIGARMVDWDHDVTRDLGCICLLFTLDDALVLSPVRRPGASTGIFQRVGIMGGMGLDSLPESWISQLLDGQNADVEDFDLKYDVVAII